MLKKICNNYLMKINNQYKKYKFYKKVVKIMF